ncbi:MAG: hypothetical protein K5Q00_00985, partial [Gammaproteobacteria bacterium]|nr:hypothetical protein [Gammaproteobacteria bacterium]
MLKKLALLLLCGAASTGFAAVNPAVAGMQSQGSLDVHLTLTPSVEITGLSDLPISYSGAAGAAMNTSGYNVDESLCVYSSIGTYTLAITTANGPGAFSASTASYGLSRVAGGTPSPESAFYYHLKFSSPGKTQDLLAYGVPYSG